MTIIWTFWLEKTIKNILKGLFIDKKFVHIIILFNTGIVLYKSRYSLLN